MEKIKNVWFDNGRIYILTSKDNMLSRPMEAFPELLGASMKERNDYYMYGDGQAIRWEAVDLDLHISSFYEKDEPNMNNPVCDLFDRFPWLDVEQVAKAMDMHKSVLVRFIYGLATPSEATLARLRETLRNFGKEMQSA